MIETIIDKIQKKISDLNNHHYFCVSFWGNDLLDSFEMNFDFREYSDSFVDLEDSERTPANLILIIGPINLFQVERIKEKYRRMDEKKRFVVQILGSLNPPELSKSYMFSKNINDVLHVDLVYKKFPIDINELVKQIVEAKYGIHE